VSADPTPVLQHLAWWPLLDSGEQQRMIEITGRLLSDKRWEAARGFELTDETRTLIAGQAALLAIGLADDAFDDVDTIIVHPANVRLHGQRSVQAGRVVADGPFTVAGQAHQRGPVLIAWDTARRELRFPGRGSNVVLHEFAHKLDMADSFVDGTPRLLDQAQYERWVEVCTAEYQRVRRGEPGPLRPYAGTNPAEFFAVATEVFFDRPLAMAAERPELYDVFRRYYRQDPAARLIDASSPPATQGAAWGDHPG
jgi:Mlc titration factor MtfA (ptsG expression regulator)